MDGLVPSQLGQKKKDLLKPKQCPNCDETNKPESKFCSKCRFVLSFDAFNETIEDAEKNKKELEELRAYMEQKKKDDAENKEALLGFANNHFKNMDELKYTLKQQKLEREEKVSRLRNTVFSLAQEIKGIKKAVDKSDIKLTSKT